MKLRWFLVSVALISLNVGLANADTVDPRFVPIGGGGSIILDSPTDPAFTFSFTKNGTVGTVPCSNFGGSGATCINPSATEFVNNSGLTWDSVTLEITQHSDDLSFSPLTEVNDPYFTSAESGFLDNGNPFVRFFGIDANHPGILPAFGCPDGPSTCTGPTSGGGEFEEFDEVPLLLLYDFAILSDVSDMTDGQSFTVVGTATAVSTVPEPATVLLALVGAFVLFLFRRR